MKHVNYNADLSEWELGLDDTEAIAGVTNAIEKLVAEAAAEMIDIAFRNEGTFAYFPIEYSTPDNPTRSGIEANVSDPLTIFIRIAANSDGEPPTYEINLRENIQDSIKSCREGGSYSYGLKQLSASLRELADEIDAAITESEQP